MPAPKHTSTYNATTPIGSMTMQDKPPPSAPDHTQAPMRLPSQHAMECRPDSISANVLLPLPVIQQAVEAKTDLPLVVIFDAEGPYVGISTPNYLSGVPLPQADLQKDIYFNGARYWRKWAEQEEKKSTSAAETEKKTKTKKIVWIASIVGFVAVVVVVLVVVLKKKRLPVAAPPISAQ